MPKHPGIPSRNNWMNELEHEAHSLVAELDAHPAARRLFDGRIGAEDYARYLVQTYHYVRWSTPLLLESGLRLKRSAHRASLGELFLQKAREEHGHERWLLADLRNLGWSKERVEHAAPCSAVNAYVAWNRYTSRCGVPLAFLGTAYVLEYLSVQRATRTVERLIAAGTIPNIRKAVTFLRGHGAADGDHVAELKSLLGSLTDPEEHTAMLLSARTTHALYLGLFEPEGVEAAAPPDSLP